MKKIFYVVVALLAWWAYACYDDEPSVPWEIPRNPEWNAFFQDLDAKVERAKSWYEQMPQEERYTRSILCPDSLVRDSLGAQLAFEAMLPMWESAFVSSKENEVAVEIPLWAKPVVYYVFDENALAYDKTGNQNYLTSYTRMVVLTDEVRGTTKGFFMTIIPSQEYKEAKKFDTYRSKYFEREEDFDGVILFHYLNGKFSNGWRYQKGKITRRVTLQKPAPQENLPTPASETVDVIQHCVRIYKNYCTDSYVVNEYGEKEYVSTNCEKVYVGTVCWNEPLAPEGGSGNQEEPDKVCDHERCAKCNGCLNPQYSACVACKCFSVKVSSSKKRVTLLQPYTLKVEIKPNVRKQEITIQECFIQMKKVNASQWENVSQGGLTLERVACNPGLWQVRAGVIGDGSEVVESEIIEVEEQYPSGREIIKNEALKAQLDALWKETKRLASPSGRQELGCWIYIDTESRSYFCGETIYGRKVPNELKTHGSTPLSAPDLTKIKKSDSPNAGIVDAVAFFHTHTPLTYIKEEGGRPVGPSLKDDSLANADRFVGLVYDYYTTENRPLLTGHALDASAGIRVFGITRKEYY